MNTILATDGMQSRGRKNTLTKYSYVDSLKNGAGAPKWINDHLDDQSIAIKAIDGSINTNYQNGLTNPYHIQMATQYYDVPGLGDTSWLDVISTVGGEIAKGVGGAISKANPYVTSTTTVAAPPVAAPSSGMPSWLLPVLLGGGGLVIVALLLKRKS